MTSKLTIVGVVVLAAVVAIATSWLSHLVSGGTEPAPEVPAWRMLYKHTRDGKPIAGSKAALVDAVRRGYPVRLAWGVQRPQQPGRSVEHSAVPIFVTVADGEEVFVQIEEHIAQTSYWSREDQNFEDPRVVWRGLFSTTGAFHAVWYNRATGETVRRMPQRVPMTWYAEVPAGAEAARPPPLYAEGAAPDAP